MSYSKIRKYISDTITSFDGDFQEHKDAFNDENIPRTRFDKAYHIAYSVPNISKSDILLTSNIQATVNFFFKGYNDPSQTLDDSMDIVNNIGLKLGRIENLTAFRSTDDYPIQSCDPSAQTNEPLESDDNSIIITLELNISVIQTLC